MAERTGSPINLEDDHAEFVLSNRLPIKVSRKKPEVPVRRPLRKKAQVSQEQSDRDLANPRNRLYDSLDDVIAKRDAHTPLPGPTDPEYGLLLDAFSEINKHSNISKITPFSSNLSNEVDDSDAIAEAILAGVEGAEDVEGAEENNGETGKNNSKFKDKLVGSRGLDPGLKPLSKIDQIFDDMTKNAMSTFPIEIPNDEPTGKKRAKEKTLSKMVSLSSALDALSGRKLRVGTMCSGTESPILALRLITEALVRMGHNPPEFEHLFSCEIVPFKQAYIELNFAPPVLFRDALELKNSEAHNAYGALKPVPGENSIDILVVGTSCIDFSTLNNTKSRFENYEEEGQSKQTHEALIEFSQRSKPTIVLLENVKGAPWEKIAARWHTIGYTTQVAGVDTKNFYIPQTRERGYMIAIHTPKANSIPGFDANSAVIEWWAILSELQRRASSPFTDFILSDDDYRLRQSRRDIAIAQANDVGVRPIDWDRCRIRYLSFRSVFKLGLARPLTRWQNNGSCRPPDFFWLSWAKAQRERIWDTLDIDHLLSLGRRDYDMQYKTRCLELSQNVDRDIDPRAWGITGCVTPSGMPYVTTRGGPITGFEALMLQGIPVDYLTLTRETPRQLQDLAGNAMTSTVVGASIISALICAFPILEETSVATSHSDDQSRPEDSLMALPDFEDSMEMIATTDVATQWTDVELKAALALRLCACESYAESKQNGFLYCTSCGHTTCTSCGGNPSHRYCEVPRKVSEQRDSPSGFELMLRQILPFQINMHAPQDIIPLSSTLLSQHVRDALNQQVLLKSIRRTTQWIVTYESHQSRLELVIGRNNFSMQKAIREENLQFAVSSKWRLFAKVREGLPAGSPIRMYLSKPIARMVCKDSMFQGSWELRVPGEIGFKLEVEGSAVVFPSFESRQGLRNPKLLDRKVCSTLTFQAIESGLTNVPREILGKFELLPDCGTACGALHCKRGDGKSPDIYFFLDPSLLGPATEDFFVFSEAHERLDNPNSRDIIARISTSKWRPDARLKTKTLIDCCSPGEWVEAPQMAIEAIDDSIYRLRGCSSDAPSSNLDCSAAEQLIWCSIKSNDEWRLKWRPGKKYTLDLVNKFSNLGSFIWIVRRAAAACTSYAWQAVDTTGWDPTPCEACAPNPPTLAWQKVQGGKNGRIVPFEDPEAALCFEKALKRRPSSFIATIHSGNDDMILDLKYNIKTLVHRAHAKLSALDRNPGLQPAFSWRLLEDLGFDQEDPFAEPELLSNDLDVLANQPSNFKKPLYDSQLRSLTWMLHQESNAANVWSEYEIEELRIPGANLRMEAKAEIQKRVRGGVLADKVGFGKTITTLSLIVSDPGRIKQYDALPEYVAGSNTIPLKATLIILPPNLIKQWHDQIKEFLDVNKGYQVLSLSTSEALMKCEFEDLKRADIVLAPWSIFGDHYFQRLAFMSKASCIPAQPGRGFDQWLNLCIKDLGGLVRDSQGCQLPGFWDEWDSRPGDADKYKNFSVLAHQESGTVEGNRPEADQKDDNGQEIAEDARGEDDSDGEESGQEAGANAPLGCKRTSAGPLAGEPDTKRPKQSHEQITGPQEPHEQLSRRNRALPKPLVASEAFTHAKWRPARKLFPLLHLFSFHRLVVDEFTYLKDQKMSSVLQLKADRKWILSGTPPMGSFGDINSMAKLIGTLLSIDEDTGSKFESMRVAPRKIQNKSYAEQFRLYSIPRSAAWYKSRSERAGEFTRRFMRQNTTDLATIQRFDNLVVVPLTTTELSTYCEVFQKLASNSTKFAKTEVSGKEPRGRKRRDQSGASDLSKASKKLKLPQTLNPSTKPDAVELEAATEAKPPRPNPTSRQKRLDFLIKGSISPENALLTCCSTRVCRDAASKGPICDEIVEEKQKECCDIMKEIFGRATRAFDHWRCHGKDSAKDSPSFHAYLASIMERCFGDATAEALIDKLLALAHSEVEWGEEWTGCPKALKTRRSDMSQISGDLSNLTVALIESTQSLRFSRRVQDVFHGRPLPECSYCGQTDLSAQEALIMGLCGHISCTACHQNKEKQNGNADECFEKGCTAPAPLHSAVRATDLGQRDQLSADSQGSKLDAVIDVLQQIGPKEKVLIFVQFSRIREALRTALRAAGVDFKEATNEKQVDLFQKQPTSRARALVLDLESENAAGWNLQMANHLIFVSTFVAKTQYQWEATMTQAVGRSLRPGQKEAVHIYNIVASKTIDVNILQAREGKVVVKRADRYMLVAGGEELDDDETGFAGAAFESAVSGKEDGVGS